jgi:hypothetical protein
MARVKRARKSKLAGAAVLVFGMAAGSVPYAFAIETGTGLPDTSVFAHAAQVPDSTLAHLRGRYLDGSQIIGFGVTFTSLWKTPDQTLTAGATMVVKFAQHSPTVSFQPNLSIVGSTGTALPTNPNQVVSGNGFQNLNGVAQGIQVAGDSNSIANNATISVTTDNLGMPAGAGGSPGSYSQSASSGSKVTAYLEKTGAGVSISVPNQGRVIQQIQGGAPNVGSAVNDSGLVQLVQTTGSLQQIQNVARIEIQLKSLNSLTNTTNFSRTLSTLHGLPH